MFIFILTILLSAPDDPMMVVGFMNQFHSSRECEASLQKVGESMLKRAAEDKEFKPSPLKCLQIKADIPEGKKES